MSALTLGGVAFAFGTLIALANKAFWVWKDPRVDGVSDMLPNTNCGACGFAGCQAFAEGLIDGKTQPAVCTVMGEDERADIAEFLNVDVGDADVRVARLLCAGDCNRSPNKATYSGLPTCGAAAAVAGGGKQCPWGCLGLGDCERSCDFDAIRMSPEGLPEVSPPLCTACGDCVDACPKDLFTIMPIAHRLLVQCRNPIDGDAATEMCSVACNSCGKCAVDAAHGVIEMIDGLPAINYELNDFAGPEAVARCPTGAIAWVEGAQFTSTAERRQPVGSTMQ
ncbi:MAG: (Fe-S)-binding protein [Gemmatimonadales bacterium]